MSAAYEPKAGDTVTITLKPAKVLRSRDDLIQMVGGTIVRREDIASIEKAPDPLPTTPGSVVRHLSGGIYARGAVGWRGIELGDLVELGLYAEVYGYTVLFDAGKATP